MSLGIVVVVVSGEARSGVRVMSSSSSGAKTRTLMRLMVTVSEWTVDR